MQEQSTFLWWKRWWGYRGQGVALLLDVHSAEIDTQVCADDRGVADTPE